MGKSPNPLCQICSEEVEDTVHFIESCHPLEDIRARYRGGILSALPSSTHLNLTECLLDSRRVLESHPEVNIEDIERISRDFLFALHTKRTTLMMPSPTSKTPKDPYNSCVPPNSLDAENSPMYIQPNNPGAAPMKEGPRREK